NPYFLFFIFYSKAMTFRQQEFARHYSLWGYKVDYLIIANWVGRMVASWSQRFLTLTTRASS
ncbi:hypothetical protein WDZ92_15170, partial [Nostoc sp. NIES-2111]